MKPFPRKFILFAAMMLTNTLTLAAVHDHAHEEAYEKKHHHEQEQKHEHEHEQKHEHHDDSDHREQSSHVHGEGQLTLVIEGKTIAITLAAPAESIIGFEHAPATEQEKSQLNKALVALNTPNTLFNFGTAAQCQTTTHTVNSPFNSSDSPKTPTAHHTDIDAEYNFECTQPATLKKVELSLLTLFPGLRTLKVDYVTENAQGSQTLSPSTIELTLP